MSLFNMCFCCSVAQSRLALCDLWMAARQAALTFTISQSLLRLMSIKSVMPSNHLILCREETISSTQLSMKKCCQKY